MWNCVIRNPHYDCSYIQLKVYNLPYNLDLGILVNCVPSRKLGWWWWSRTLSHQEMTSQITRSNKKLIINLYLFETPHPFCSQYPTQIEVPPPPTWETPIFRSMNFAHPQTRRINPKLEIQIFTCMFQFWICVNVLVRGSHPSQYPILVKTRFSLIAPT